MHIFLRIAIGIAAGCAPAFGASFQSQPDQDPANPWPIDPGRAEALIDDEAVARLEARAKEERTTGLAVAVGGRIIIMQGDDEPIGAMSVSKSIASLAIGFLVEDGTVALDDSVANWVPQWRDTAHEAIAIRHLLSHTSGLNIASADLNGGEIAAHAIASPLSFEPGSRLAYNNNAVDFLAVVVQRASGTPLDDLLEERIFDPLGITDASWLEDAQGVPFAAGELKIRPTDLLRIGQMLVDGGVWDGRQIVSKDWVAQSTTSSQEHVPSIGFLWTIRGDFRLTLTSALIQSWRDAGVPPEIADAVEPMAGKTFASYQPFQAALLDHLGEDGFKAWQEWIRENMGKVEYARQVMVGPTAGLYGQGWLGQFLVVLPETRTVAVRMREFMEVDVDRSRGEQFGYRDFVQDVSALAKPMKNAPPDGAP